MSYTFAISEDDVSRRLDSSRRSEDFNSTNSQYSSDEENERVALRTSNWFTREQFERGKKSKEEMKGSRKNVRKFYQRQNRLVDSFLSLDDINLDVDVEDDDNFALHTKLAINGSFVLNVLLFGAKIYAAISSGSLSVIASALDSFLDLLSGSIIFLTNYFIAKKNPYIYPAGKARLEPLGIIIFSACMFVATLQLITTSVQDLVSQRSDISITIPVIVIMCFTIVSKLVLYLYCRAYSSNSSVNALAQDHRNDVLSNSFGVATAFLGYYYFWWLDPLGAIVIGLYIMVNWFRTGYAHVIMLTGKTANSYFLKQITFICIQHDSRILQIDTVRAFHLGLGFLVEVDIVLPEEMTLKDAHDIGQSLQDKLELISLVERAFVHLDYETSHSPEHAPLKKKIELVDI